MAEPWFPEEFERVAWTLTPHARGRDRHLDRLFATLAQLQHGVVECVQLRALRVTHRQLGRRVHSGHLHRLFTGVYAVGSPTLTHDGRRMAAFLRSGRGARLAGWSGATHRGLLPEAGARVDVAIPPERRIAVPRVDVVRAKLVPGEVSVANGIPTHTVARLLLDLARRTDDPDLLEWAWRQAIFKKVLDVGEIELVLGNHDGDPGAPALRALCDRRAELIGTLHNRFELRMLSIIREAGLPDPLCNVPYEVAPGVVLKPDFRIPSLALVVEGDGRDGHEDVEFEISDDERDACYRRLGNTVMRVGWWEAKRERGKVVGRPVRHRERHRR